MLVMLICVIPLYIAQQLVNTIRIGKSWGGERGRGGEKEGGREGVGVGGGWKEGKREEEWRDRGNEWSGGEWSDRGREEKGGSGQMEGGEESGENGVTEEGNGAEESGENLEDGGRMEVKRWEEVKQ